MGFSTTLLVLSIWHIYVAGRGTLFFTIPPLLLSISLVGVGYWLWAKDYEEAVVSKVSFLVFAGAGLLGVVTVLTVFYETWVHGVRLENVEFIVTNNIVVGSVGGLLIGYFWLRASRAERKLKALNGILRHDVRNEMNVLLAWLMELEAHAEGDQLETVKKAKGSTKQVIELTETTRKILNSMVEGTPDLEPVDLKKYLDRVVENHRSKHPEAEFRVEGEIPDVKVYANDMLNSVFRNLFTNSIHHNDKETPRIEVEVEEGKDYVTAIISDNGPGVPDEEKESIFADTSRKLRPNSGLGLYLVSLLVDSYGGEVWVEDNEPEGAVFRVKLRRYGGDGSG